MADYPGVYIEETGTTPKPIEGVPTHTAALLGETERGPILPSLVTSYTEYQRIFGTIFAADMYLPYAVRGFFENGGQRAYICRVAGSAATTASATFGNFTLRALGPGAWGNRIVARITTASPGVRVQLAYYASAVPPFDPFAEPAKLPRPDRIEEFQNWTPQAGWKDSVLVTSDPDPEQQTQLPADGTHTLSGGADSPSPIEVDDYALDRLEDATYRHVSLIYAPNATVDLARALVTHCEKVRFRMAVIDAPQGQANPSLLKPRNAIADSSHAAYYYPWLNVAGHAAASHLVPPGGHVLGIYARTDTERGVAKAPANQLVRGAQSLEFNINAATGDPINADGVNAIRAFPGRGITLWGARTLSSNQLWKYVNIRRYFLFLEQSIDEGTQWVVFEPNNEKLWSRVQDTIRQFLRSQWLQGALQGAKEEHAFFINCDRTTMTQDDIDNGRLICLIGVAPLRPAEYVIFRIGQYTLEANS